MRRKISGILKFLLGWPLSFLALFFIIKTFSPRLQNVSYELANINLFLLFSGLTLFVLYYLLRSYIWYKLLIKMGYDLPLRESIYLWATSQIKRYIPGNIWSFVGTAVLFGEKNVSKKDVAYGLLLEAQLVILSSLVLSLLCLNFLNDKFVPVQWQNLLTISTVIGAVLLVVLYPTMPKIIKRFKNPYLAKIAHISPRFSYQQTFYFFALMLLSFIFFGLGYYFTFTSLVFLDPNHLLFFLGFFVLSLLLGFLSFITPTGLGVREGVIAFGLASFIPLALASFVALFARVVLVVAEIIFLTTTYAIHKLNNPYLSKVYKTLKKYPHETILTICYLHFTIYFSAISILRHENFYTGRFDLGNMAQTVWNTAHGRIFELTNPNGTEIVSRLAFHADFILVLLAPFYWLWESPNMLLLIQAVVVGIGGFFVFALTRDILKNKTLALILAILYFLNPSLQRAVIYDFHAVTLATTFFLGAFYFLYKKKYGWFIAFAFLAGITKEQVWAVIALLGLYVAFVQKKLVLGIGIFAVCVITTYFLLWQAIPNASGSEHFALSYYQQAQDGDSPSDLIKSLLLDPVKTFGILTEESRLYYLHQLFIGVGYLPIGAPLYLIFAGPDLAINLLSSRPQLQQIYYQYTANITPFLFISSIFALRLLMNKFKFLTPFRISIFIVVTGLISAYLYGPLPGARGANLAMITRPMENKKEVDNLMKSIPQEAKVAASNSLGAQLSHRRFIYTLPQGVKEADYVIFKLSDPNNSSNDNFASIINQLKTNTSYKIIYDDGNILAFQKRAIAKNN